MRTIINRLSMQARLCRDLVTLVQQHMTLNPNIKSSAQEFQELSVVRRRLDELMYEIEVNLPKHMEMCKNKKG